MKQFQLKTIYLLIPFILISYSLTIYILYADFLFNAIKVLFKNIVLKTVSNILLLSNVINFVFLYGTQKFQYKKIQKLVLRTNNLCKNLCAWLPLENENYLPYLIKFTIKSLVFGTILLMYMLVSVYLIAPGMLSVYTLPGFLIPVFVNKFYPDLYYGGMLLADFLLLQINKDLRRIMNVAGVGKSIDYVNDEDLSDVTNLLDTMSINYIELIEIVKDFNRIMSLRVVFWLFLGVLNFLILLFMQYIFVGIPIRYGHSLNILISVSGLVDLFYEALEFYHTVSACSSVMRRVNETETILTSILRGNGPFGRNVTFS